jgi:RNA polymerase sigma factor (sigma-70 family)
VGQGHRGEVHRQIHALFHAGMGVGLSDGQLLERFTTPLDEDAERAFAVLVQRHGPAVLRVCQGVLRDSNDAEDAFQATFLVLACKARSIRRRNSVGSWLFGVALRVASDMRRVAARRRTHERRVAGMKQEAMGGEDDDSSQVVLEELGRLPDRLRAAVVLCYMEGRTCEEAAHQLGWPVGTVKTRLAQARERLRGRLIRRGLASLLPPAVVASSAEAIPTASTVPIALEQSAVHAALRFASGKATVEVVSSSVIALAEGVQKAMSLTRLKLGVSAALVIGAVAAGASVVARPFPSSSNTGQPAKAERVILAAADTRSVSPDLGGQNDFEASGPSVPSLRELQVRLAHAKHSLNEKETHFKNKVVPSSVVEAAVLEVDILQAKLDASKEDLGDELERLEGRLRVKQAEADAAKIRSLWAQKPNSERPAPSEVALSKADLTVREAELMEVEIRIKQVRRRLGLK